MDKAYMVTLLIVEPEYGSNPKKWDWNEVLEETNVTLIDCKEVEVKNGQH